MHLPLPPLEPEYIAAKEFTVVERLGSPAAIPHLLPRTVDWERLYRFLLNFSRRPWPRKPKGPIFSKGCWRLIQDPDPIIPGNAMGLGTICIQSRRIGTAAHFVDFIKNLEQSLVVPTNHTRTIFWVNGRRECS
jgi:hypothetical protein